MGGEYKDPDHKVLKLGDNYKWSNNNQLDIYESDNIEYIKNILNQSYQKTLSK